MARKKYVADRDSIRCINRALAALAAAHDAMEAAVSAEGEQDVHGLAEAVAEHALTLDAICKDLAVRTPPNGVRRRAALARG